MSWFWPAILLLFAFAAIVDGDFGPASSWVIAALLCRIWKVLDEKRP